MASPCMAAPKSIELIGITRATSPRGYGKYLQAMHIGVSVIPDYKCRKANM